MKRGRDETDTHTGQGPSAQEAGRAGYEQWSANLSRGTAGGSAHLSAADSRVNGGGVCDHRTPHDAARVVREDGFLGSMCCNNCNIVATSGTLYIHFFNVQLYVVMIDIKHLLGRAPCRCSGHSLTLDLRYSLTAQTFVAT